MTNVNDKNVYGRCARCAVDILDEAVICPLCGNVIEAIDDSEDIQHSKSAMYPDIEYAMRKIKFAIKLFAFIAIVAEIAFIYISYAVNINYRWALVSGTGLLFAVLSMIYSVGHNTGHRRKIMFECAAAMVLVVALDIIIGYQGWSINIGFPVIIIFVNVAILILMIVNMSNWQNYILLQLYITVLSVVLIILVLVGLIDKPGLSVITFGVSLLFTLGIFMLGGKRAIIETKRRFRV